jgi:hypothetical protein
MIENSKLKATSAGYFIIRQNEVFASDIAYLTVIFPFIDNNGASSLIDVFSEDNVHKDGRLFYQVLKVA